MDKKRQGNRKIKTCAQFERCNNRGLTLVTKSLEREVIKIECANCRFQISNSHHDNVVEKWNNFQE